MAEKPAKVEDQPPEKEESKAKAAEKDEKKSVKKDEQKGSATPLTIFYHWCKGIRILLR